MKLINEINERKSMKNTKTIALIAIVSLIFTACGGGSDDSQTVRYDSQTTSESTIAASTEESSLSGSINLNF